MPAQQTQQGRFTTAVRADDGKDFAPLDLQIKAIENRRAFKAEAKIADLNHMPPRLRCNR